MITYKFTNTGTDTVTHDSLKSAKVICSNNTKHIINKQWITCIKPESLFSTKYQVQYMMPKTKAAYVMIWSIFMHASVHIWVIIFAHVAKIQSTHMSHMSTIKHDETTFCSNASTCIQTKQKTWLIRRNNTCDASQYLDYIF